MRRLSFDLFCRSCGSAMVILAPLLPLQDLWSTQTAFGVPLFLIELPSLSFVRWCAPFSENFSGQARKRVPHAPQAGPSRTPLWFRSRAISSSRCSGDRMGKPLLQTSSPGVRDWQRIVR